MAPTNEDLEQYRDPDGGLDQWVVKKAFIKKNWDLFPEDRRQKLITLAHCFHNIHVWGCTYPAKVMAEVKQMSEGLMTTKPKAERQPKAVKVDFVPATPLSNTFAVLDDGNLEDSKTREFAAGQIDIKKKTRKKKEKTKTNAKSEVSNKETTVLEEAIDRIDFPRCGLGFKSTTNTVHNESKSNFVFGKKSDYIARLGFVRATEVNEGFQFGQPIKPAVEPSSGHFQFGVDAKNRSNPTDLKEFSFGNGGKTLRRASDELERKFESALFLESDSVSTTETSKVTDNENQESEHPQSEFAEISKELEAVRSKLKEVRPPLAQARIEFLMLQVNLNTGGKLEVQRGTNDTCLVFEKVILASGANETAAYEDLRNKIFHPEAWNVCARGRNLFLEVETFSRNQKRREAIRAIMKSTSTEERLGEAGKDSQAPQNSHKGPGGASESNARIKRLPRSVQSEILRNLDAVRRTLWTQNFKMKIEMLGGFERDPTTALNIAFQMAVLKPVREADVANTSCRFHITGEGGQRKCILKVHGVLITEAEATSNRDAKQKVSKLFLDVLRSKQNLKINFENGENRLVTFGDARSDPRPTTPTMTNKPANNKSENLNSEKGNQNNESNRSKVQQSSRVAKSEGFFLIKSAEKELDLGSTLNRSLHANEFSPAVFVFSRDNEEEVCKLTMSGKVNFKFEGRGRTRAVAKDQAIRSALNTFIATCPTIEVSSISQEANEFFKETMPLGTESKSVTDGLNRKLGQDNVGFQLMERMGWKGGSLGGGSGLIEPIMFQDNSGNTGLGYAKSEKPGKRFTANIYSTLRAFLRETDVFQELKFSPTFSNVERKHIHSIARQLGLKSKSSDRPEGRVLCVSHSIDWKMVLESLKQHGGSLGKFRLLEPGSYSLPEQRI